MATTKILHIGFCPCCGTGPLGIRICQRCGAPLVMCEECDAIWLDPQLHSDPVYPEQPSLPCPHCGKPLCDGSQWANRPELERIGWAKFIRGEGDSLAESADPDTSPG